MAPQRSRAGKISRQGFLGGEDAARWRLAVVAVSGSAALAVKLYLALSSFGCQDMLFWHRFLYNLRQFGTFGLYHRLYYFNHPPAMVHLLAFLGWIADATGVSFAFWMRLPAILADVGSLLLVTRLLPAARGGRRETALLLLALAPASLMIAGFHGNTDPLMIFLVVAAVCAAEQESVARAAWTGLLFGLGLGVKASALILAAPIFFWWRSWRTRGSFAAAVGATVIATSSPAIWRDPVFIVKRVLGYGSSAGIWGLTDLRDQVSLALGMGARPAAVLTETESFLWRLLLLAGLAALAAWLNLRQPRPPLYLTCGLVMALFLLLTPGFGVQYLAWLVPWIPGAGWLASLFFDAASGWYLFRFYAGGADGFPWLTSAGEPTALVRAAGLACWLAIGWACWALWRRIAASLAAQVGSGTAPMGARAPLARMAPLAPAVPAVPAVPARRRRQEAVRGAAPGMVPGLVPGAVPGAVQRASGLAVVAGGATSARWRRVLLTVVCAALPVMALARAARHPVAPFAAVAERFDVPFVAATSSAGDHFPAGGVLPGESGPGWRSAAAPTRRQPQDLTLTFAQPTDVDGLDVVGDGESGHALREWTVEAERAVPGIPATPAIPAVPAIPASSPSPAAPAVPGVPGVPAVPAGAGRPVSGVSGAAGRAEWVTLRAGPPLGGGDASAVRLRFPVVAVRRLRLRISRVDGDYASVRRVSVHRPPDGNGASVVASSSAWALSADGLLSSPLDNASFEAGRTGWLSLARPAVQRPETLTVFFAAPRTLERITLYGDPLQVHALRTFVFLGLERGRWTELPETRVADGRAATSFSFALAPRTLDGLRLRVTRVSGWKAIVRGLFLEPPPPGPPVTPAGAFSRAALSPR